MNPIQIEWRRWNDLTINLNYLWLWLWLGMAQLSLYCLANANVALQTNKSKNMKKWFECMNDRLTIIIYLSILHFKWIFVIVVNAMHRRSSILAIEIIIYYYSYYSFDRLFFVFVSVAFLRIQNCFFFFLLPSFASLIPFTTTSSVPHSASLIFGLWDFFPTNCAWLVHLWFQIKTNNNDNNRSRDFQQHNFSHYYLRHAICI